ncbi:MAG: cobyric acid synthase [Pseudomonadota bacterium]
MSKTKTKNTNLTGMAHGGDLLRMAEHAGLDAHSITDFSVNVRPDGPPEFIMAALTCAMDKLSSYPSPHAQEAKMAAASRYGMPMDCFVFGNGSNELIHAAVRHLAKSLQSRALTDEHAGEIPTAFIVEPAFSEYALACEHAGLHIERKILVPNADNTCICSILKDVAAKASPQSIIFFANPSNPSGLYVPREHLSQIIRQYPDITWIIDEAFIEYADHESKSSLLTMHNGAAAHNGGPHKDDATKDNAHCTVPQNCIILRSLTKFHAIPAVRVGFLAAHKDMAHGIQGELCSWNVSAFSIAAACAVLQDTSDFANQTRRHNAQRRQDLIACLKTVQDIEIIESVANYILFRWPLARHLMDEGRAHLPSILLKEHGIAIRDCANYAGLDDGSWFRVAVRFPHEHAALAQALLAIAQKYGHTQEHIKPCTNRIISQHKRPALMLQGTSSNAGKSILAAAFCRILHQDGYDVAPFKAQNMSLNSGVTPLGEEMGRAQLVQAQAARVIPDARMNPILLKPHSDTGSQIVVLGKPIGHMGVREYFSKKSELWATVQESYDTLAQEHEVMVLEGAGSPAEINLKASDVVNMRMAAHADASVLLVGDIDRGGVYASFLGTWMTFTPAERRLLRGFLVNRFRGDASLLNSAHDYMEQHTGVPVLGVVPFMRNLNLPEEDMAGFDWNASGPSSASSPNAPNAYGHMRSPADDMENHEHISQKSRPLDVAVIMLRHVSNYTDMEPLTIEPDVCVRPVRHADDFGTPDLVLIPGSKSVTMDLAIVRENGLAHCITEHARRHGWLFGICGGLQILGEQIHDPHGIESAQKYVQGLGIMELSSTFAAEKTLTLVHDVASPLGVTCKGYEIHHGLTQHSPKVTAIAHHGNTMTGQKSQNVTYTQGRCWATYLHGIFDDDAFRRAFIDHVRADLGLQTQGRIVAHYDIDAALDALADHVREHIDITAIYKTMGLA